MTVFYTTSHSVIVKLFIIFYHFIFLALDLQYTLTEMLFLTSLRVAENEIVNKMSFHNLATVFGPTLLRPSEKDSKIPSNPTQPISMSDSWSLEVMSQVTHLHCVTPEHSNLGFILRSRCFFMLLNC